MEGNGRWQAVWDTLAAYGPFGLFFICILDTAFLPTAQAVDLLIIAQAGAAPETGWLMWFCATIGSTLGAYVLYEISRRGGGWALRKSVSEETIEGIRQKIRKYDAAALILPAMVPIPLAPMKVFIVVAGALGVETKRVLAAMLFARSVRYGALVLLGVYFGDRAWGLFKENALAIVGVLTALTALFFLARKLRSHGEGKKLP